MTQDLDDFEIIMGYPLNYIYQISNIMGYPQDLNLYIYICHNYPLPFGRAPKIWDLRLNAG